MEHHPHRPGGRADRLRHRAARAVLPAALVSALLLGACTTDPLGELEFLDRVRNEYPSLSVSELSDDELLALGRATCSPSGLDDAEREQLDRAGIDPAELAGLAEGLCPSR